MSPFDAKDLLDKYHKGLLTDEEKALVESWYLKQKLPLAEVDFDQLEKDRVESLDNLLDQISPQPVKRMWPRYAVAASVLIAIGSFFVNRTKPAQQQENYTSNSHEIKPGGNKAILVLADGRKISLSDAQNGQIASQGNVVIKKVNSGQISYLTPGKPSSVESAKYNTVMTPRGGQFEFTLADGSKVWLNAASSLKFPVAFNGKERKVELTGEAYFEVIHNAGQPFRIVVGGQVVEDLGTEFNINAYPDEDAVKTTLVKGSVSISAAGKANVLKPGQQAQLKNGSLNIVSNADLDEALSWKQGFFYFKDADLKTVMREMSRWYDADITYEDGLTDRRFSGQISKSLNASQFLDILSFKKIHYQIEGKKIIITQKQL